MVHYLECDHASTEVIEVALSELFDWGYLARVCVSCGLLIERLLDGEVSK